MTTYTITIMNLHTGKAVPGMKVTGLTLDEVEEAKAVFANNPSNAELLQTGQVGYRVKEDATRYTTLKLTDEQVEALQSALYYLQQAKGDDLACDDEMTSNYYELMHEGLDAIDSKLVKAGFASQRSGANFV